MLELSLVWFVLYIEEATLGLRLGSSRLRLRTGELQVLGTKFTSTGFGRM